MCTLALLRGRSARYPLVVAANRDERYDRASSPPLLWRDPVTFVGGRDEVAGGTWLGVNVHGVVVGLTNHWTGEPPDPARASRGAVVRELLRARDVDEVAALLQERDPDATNPFLLVAAQRDGAAWWASSREGLAPHAIALGVFALGNVLPGQDRDERARGLGLCLEAIEEGDGSDPDGLVRGLARCLARHDADRGPLTSVCVHTDRGYGTVSSTIVLLGHERTDDRLHHAPGPPCTHAHVDASHLFEELRALARHDARAQ